MKIKDLHQRCLGLNSNISIGMMHPCFSANK